MCMENLENKIKDCKSYSEVGRLLGYNYCNARVKQCVIEYCLEHEIDIEKQIFSWKDRRAYCLNCGKEIIGEGKFKKKFCCQSCANSYTNKLRGHKSIEERCKISDSLKKTLQEDNKYITLGEAVKKHLILNPLNVSYDSCKIILREKTQKKKCVICGEFYVPSLNKGGKLSKKCTCSIECHKQLKSLKSEKVQERLISDGSHKGWQSRNILSYAESFWINVLNNNDIPFISNKPVKQENGRSNYFLDFYVEKNNKLIDLEIDGKQHEYDDRKESDARRDVYLKSLGFIVYLIKWNEISSEK